MRWGTRRGNSGGAGVGDVDRGPNLSALVSAFQRVYDLFMVMALVSDLVCLALGHWVQNEHHLAIGLGDTMA